MTGFDKLIDKVLSVKRNIQLKAIAIFFFGIIALIMCSPVIKNPEVALSTQHVTVIALCVFAIIITILSDRLVSLSVSKDKLNITLAELKQDVKERLDVVKDDLKEFSSASSTSAASDEVIKEAEQKLAQAEDLLSGEKAEQSVEELLASAQDIGKAMGTLEEIMKSYRKFKK